MNGLLECGFMNILFCLDCSFMEVIITFLLLLELKIICFLFFILNFILKYKYKFNIILKNVNLM